jgi:hypothetical protein
MRIDFSSVSCWSESCRGAPNSQVRGSSWLLCLLYDHSLVILFAGRTAGPGVAR